MDISTELYKVFYMVARYKSFSKAASKLFVSQSAVSQSVKSLEETLGFPLLIRTTKKVSLTIDGEILYTHLEQAFGLIDSAEEKLKTRQDHGHGQIIFAATDTLCKYYLLPRIKKLSENFPGIKIKIINGTSIYCLNLLEKAKVDFALINIPHHLDANNFSIEKSYPFKDVFICRNSTPIPQSVNLKTISEYPLLALDNKSVTRVYLDQLFLDNGINITPEVELQNVDLLIEMAAIGLGIAFVPDLCVKDRSLKILDIKEKIPVREYGIISLKQLPHTPAAETFLEYI